MNINPNPSISHALQISHPLEKRQLPQAVSPVSSNTTAERTEPDLSTRGQAIPHLSLYDEAPLSEPSLRLQIYAGTSDPDKLKQWARQKLGLEGVTLPDAQTRHANFQKFADRYFPQRPIDSDEFDANYYGPTPDTPLYQLFETYAQTDYGALMIQKVLEQAGEKPFVVKAVEGSSPKAWDDLMVFPPDFPKPDGHFKYGGQAIDPLAILHHEFEHTRFGKHAQSLEAVLDEEAFTVAEIENPVRVLNGYEPRYTYTQVDAVGTPIVTFSILNPEQKKPGAWTFEPQDPRCLIPSH